MIMESQSVLVEISEIALLTAANELNLTVSFGCNKASTSVFIGEGIEIYSGHGGG
jgi:hypothetical protein